MNFTVRDAGSALDVTLARFTSTSNRAACTGVMARVLGDLHFTWKRLPSRFDAAAPSSRVVASAGGPAEQGRIPARPRHRAGHRPSELALADSPATWSYNQPHQLTADQRSGKAEIGRHGPMPTNFQSDRLKNLRTVTLQGHAWALNTLAFSADDTMLASCGYNGTTIWNLGNLATSISLPTSCDMCGAFVRGNDYFVVCDDRKAEVWRVSTQELVHTVPFPEPVDTHCASPIVRIVGSRLVIGTHRFVQTSGLLDAHKPEIYALRADEDLVDVKGRRGGPLVAYVCRRAANRRPHLRLIDVRSHKMLLKVAIDGRYPILSPDGRLCALAQPYREDIEIWSLQEGRLASKLCGLRYDRSSNAFTADNRFLVNPGMVGVWRVSDGRLISEIHADDDWFPFAFCPARRGRVVAFKSRGLHDTHRVLFLNMLTKRALGLADGHASSGRLFSPGGRWFATVSDCNYQVDRANPLPEGAVVVTDLKPLYQHSPGRVR